jgi:hypothetical protein
MGGTFVMPTFLEASIKDFDVVGNNYEYLIIIKVYYPS